MSGTLSAVSLPPREAIEFLRGKVNIPTQGWSDVWEGGHARGFMVAGAASDAILADFRAAVSKALEQGTTLAEFRADFDAIVQRHGWAHTGTPGWRAQIIYETNLSMAYAAGRHAQMTEPDTLAVFPYWQYVHSGARHPRKQHLAWNGLVLRADDPFWKTHYPPNGWQCGCRVRPLSARDLARQGKSGPDQAPRIETRPWRRPSDGAVLQVPDGIDPGFGYNVGEAWRGMPPIPGAARWAPPPGWMPPVPGVAAEAGPRGAAAPIPPLEAPVVTAPAFGAWLEITRGSRAEATPVVVGVIGMALRARAGVAAPTTVLTERNFRRIEGKEARTGKPIGLAPEDVARLPELLASPIAVLRQRDNGNLVYVFRPLDPRERRLGKIVVVTDRVLALGSPRRKFSVSEVRSAGLVARADLADARSYEVLEGEL